MFVSNDQLEGLKHAYQVIGVPLDASAHSIKQAYRRLIKRWHPDRYANDTAGHVEATQMSKLINEAYSAVAHAPLRYHVETYSRKPTRESAPTASAPASEAVRATSENITKTDRIEFWVRFVCGAVVGIFVCFDLVVSAVPDSSASLPLLALGGLAVVLGFGLGAARYGDKFWHFIFRHWWLWP